MDPAIFGIYLLQIYKETMKMDKTHPCGHSQLDPLCLTFMLITAHFLTPPPFSMQTGLPDERSPAESG